MTEKQLQEQDTTHRLDQRLNEEAQAAAKTLLDKFTDVLRSVIIVFDYDIQDAGSLPAGVVVPRRNIRPLELLDACRAVDKVGHGLRHEHDTAMSRREKHMLTLISDLQQRVAESTGNKDKENTNDEQQQETGSV